MRSERLGLVRRKGKRAEPAAKALSVATRDGILVPRVIAAAGDQAARRFLEFFAATIRNKNTRMAYYRAAARFFAWCDHHKIGEIADIEPLHVAAYVEALGKDFEKPTEAAPPCTGPLNSRMASTMISVC